MHVCYVNQIRQTPCTQLRKTGYIYIHMYIYKVAMTNKQLLHLYPLPTTIMLQVLYEAQRSNLKSTVCLLAHWSRW